MNETVTDFYWIKEALEDDEYRRLRGEIEHNSKLINHINSRKLPNVLVKNDVFDAENEESLLNALID